MHKKPKNHNKNWSQEEIQELKMLAEGNTPTRIIGMKLQRTEDSIRSKVFDENISLKPTNQSPYNKRPK